MKSYPILCLCALLMVSGCSQPRIAAERMVGRQCQVQFRRDALGVASNTGASPTTGEFNGVTMLMYGKLDAALTDSVVLSNDKGTHFIPMHSILIISVDPPAQK